MPLLPGGSLPAASPAGPRSSRRRAAPREFPALVLAHFGERRVRDGGLEARRAPAQRLPEAAPGCHYGGAMVEVSATAVPKSGLGSLRSGNAASAMRYVFRGQRVTRRARSLGFSRASAAVSPSTAGSARPWAEWGKPTSAARPPGAGRWGLARARPSSLGERALSGRALWPAATGPARRWSESGPTGEQTRGAAIELGALAPHVRRSASASRGRPARSRAASRPSTRASAWPGRPARTGAVRRPPTRAR